MVESVHCLEAFIRPEATRSGVVVVQQRNVFNGILKTERVFALSERDPLEKPAAHTLDRD